MSNLVSATVGRSTYGTLDRLLSSVGGLQEQRVGLQQQVSTGKAAESYAGLGAGSARVLDLTAASRRADAYTQAITHAQGKAAVIQDALGGLGKLVNDIVAKTLDLTDSSPAATVEAVSLQAKQALQQIGSLLNTTYAGDYVFAGADTANAPVPGDVTSSGLFAQIGAQVAALATVPTTSAVGVIIARTVAIASDTSAGTTVFSSYLAGAGTAAPLGEVQVGDAERVSLDLPANRNAGAVSDPAINGTGSAVSDILRSLAVVANATPAIAANPDFKTLMRDAARTLTSAGQTLAVEAGRIGLTQNTLTAASERHASVKLVLSKQLSGLTDVDMASAISRLQAVTSQLEASYNVLSMARQLNLASYL